MWNSLDKYLLLKFHLNGCPRLLTDHIRGYHSRPKTFTTSRNLNTRLAVLNWTTPLPRTFPSHLIIFYNMIIWFPAASSEQRIQYESSCVEFYVLSDLWRYYTNFQVYVSCWLNVTDTAKGPMIAELTSVSSFTHFGLFSIIFNSPNIRLWKNRMINI